MPWLKALLLIALFLTRQTALNVLIITKRTMERFVIVNVIIQTPLVLPADISYGILFKTFLPG